MLCLLFCKFPLELVIRFPLNKEQTYPVQLLFSSFEKPVTSLPLISNDI